MAISPPDDVLRAAFRDLRSKNPTLGTNKLHALLLSQYEGWVVSEKRAKKILASENLFCPRIQFHQRATKQRALRSKAMRLCIPGLVSLTI